jgi:hypothetical protein
MDRLKLIIPIIIFTLFVFLEKLFLEKNTRSNVLENPILENQILENQILVKLLSVIIIIYYSLIDIKYGLICAMGILIYYANGGLMEGLDHLNTVNNNRIFQHQPQIDLNTINNIGVSQTHLHNDLNYEMSFKKTPKVLDIENANALIQNINNISSIVPELPLTNSPEIDTNPIQKLNNHTKLNNSNNQNNPSNQNNPVELVVARYNENLNWLERNPFSNYPSIIYNKGVNTNFNAHQSQVINLKNIGKCDHTYLYHIIENYENLADITVFLPGSTNMDYKMKKAKMIMKELGKSNKSGVFVYENYYKNIRNDLYNFSILNHKTANSDNLILNPDIMMEKSRDRPFGKWYDLRFDKTEIHYLSYWGIMAIHKDDILQHSKMYYKKLIKDLDHSVSPEEGHYYERAWEAVFYPMNNTTFIKNNSK